MNAGCRSMAAGEPGRVVQLCYLVPELEDAVARWVTRTSAGPFYRLTVDLAGQNWFGRTACGSADIAVGFQQDMCIELVAYRGSGPAVFDPQTSGIRSGLHHVQLACDDLDAAITRHRANGEGVVTDHLVPGFGRAIMIDTRDMFGHFVEYGAWTQPVHDALADMRAAQRDWDGRDPLRPYPAIG